MDLLDSTTTQRPLDVLVLLSYPVSLSAAAAASLWTWLAVAVAGVWIWRLISHQSSAAAARSKELGTLSTATHLLPPEPTTTACQRPQSAVACSPSSRQEEEEPGVQEIEPECSRSQKHGYCPIPVPVLDVQEAFSIGRKAVAYFEGHGGRCRGSSAPVRDEDQGDVQDQVEASSVNWCLDVAAIIRYSLPDHHRCSGTKVVRRWEDVHHEAGQERDTADNDDALTVTIAHRLSDLGFRRFQDWGVINGNVVRLWHAN